MSPIAMPPRGCASGTALPVGLKRPGAPWPAIDGGERLREKGTRNAVTGIEKMSDEKSGALAEGAARWLAAWDEQGWHRTATAGDEAGARWLAGEAAVLGVEPLFEEFSLDRLDPVAAYLELDGERLPAVPVFDAPATRGDGISGALGPIGSDAAIGVAELSPRAVYTPEYERLRRGTTHRGLVILCTGAQPGMGPLNAERFREPYGAPAIHLASEARETVLAAAARGTVARLVAHSTRTPAQGHNLLVTMRSRDRERPPVVIMTPRSSWWQSTAERGGGIVCWLEALRALVAAPPACDVVFTANSGHELGHLGLDDFLARRPGWERHATWLHFGANLGAAGGDLSVLSASDDLRALTAAALSQAGQEPDHLAPRTTVPSGETRDIHRAGGRYTTLVGSNPWFHLPQDRWPHAVDAAAVACIAAGAARLALTLTR